MGRLTAKVVSLGQIHPLSQGFFSGMQFFAGQSLFRVGLQRFRQFAFFWGAGCFPEQIYQHFQGPFFVFSLRSGFLATDHQKSFFVDPVFQPFSDERFLGVVQSPGGINIKKRIHFRFHFVDVLPSCTGAAGSAIADFLYDCVTVQGSGFYDVEATSLLVFS